MPETIIVLILLMIIGALVAIETPNLLHSVISVGAVGFLLSIVFLFLSAPDLAITQMAVEVITLVLLLQATARSETEEVADQGRFFARVVTGTMVLILALFGARMLADFPEFGRPVMDRFADAPSNTYLRAGLEQTGAANIVTAVLLDFRAYDTLGEASVLFCAVMGALSILRRQARKQPEEGNEVEET
jgi:multisubunit Na+/H+ antiporter MnhB subunit